MISFVVEETHLNRLTPAARREFLNLVEAEVSRLKLEIEEQEWDPDGDTSYPLTTQEALSLIRGLEGPQRELLRVFCKNFDGKIGRAELDSLFRATGRRQYEELGNDVNLVTQRVHSVTENSDAWLLNWRAEDWQWDEHNNTYAKGAYFISGPAIHALREAFGMVER